MGARSQVVLLAAAAAIIGACSTDPGVDQFEWTLTPKEGATTLGGLVSFEIQIKSKTNINSDVEFTTSPLPSGLASDLPASVTSTASTVSGSFYAAPGTELGLYEIEISAREKGGEYGLPQTFKLTVSAGGEAADFSVEVDPTAMTMPVETPQTFTFRVAPLNGFTGTVSIQLSGLPDGNLYLLSGPTPATLTFAAGDGSKGGTMVLQYLPSPPVPAQVQVVVTVTSGTLGHTRTITLTLPTPSSPG
jgi:hypothetical protein